MKKIFLSFLTILGISASLSAQLSCPTNVDFELGSLSTWLFYTGTCCPINTPTLSGAVINRHTLTTGAAVDQYGGFPIVAPGGGSYSLKLGNNSTGAQAERARYYVQVPVGVNNYSLIYRYAVVFENPNHVAAQQPRFEVTAYDSLTNTVVSCAQITYVSSASLPGFQLSTIGNQIWYKSWTTGSLDLSGYAGQTLAVDFASGDCSQTGHFGYGYVDITCGLFAILNVNCDGAPTTILNAPPGFQSYQWTTSTYTVIGTGQTITIPTPLTSTQYHVILTPYTGFGCPDTLTTNVSIASMTLSPTNDTTICPPAGISLTSGVQGTAPYLHSWFPAAGLSCTNCANPIASPAIPTTYYVTVTDANGCLKTDSVEIATGHVPGVTTIPVSCFGGNDGSASAVASGGTPPYSFSWHTIPTQSAATLTNLTPGIYTVTITDDVGCSKTSSAIVGQPITLNASIINPFDINCFGWTTGQGTLTATGGTAPYSYYWNTSIPQTTATVTNLGPGTHTAIVTDSKGCTSTASVTITEPAALNASATSTNAVCIGTNSGAATASATGGTLPYNYYWSTTPLQTGSIANNLAIGTYTVTVVDINGCTGTATAVVNPPVSIPVVTVSNVNHVICTGGSNGSATATATGTTGPYAYHWNTIPAQNTATANNLTVGSYVVTATDSKGCTATTSLSIIVPNPLGISIGSLVHVSCNGGATGGANATVTGGIPPFNYSWSTTPVQATASVTNLPAGTYTVIVTDANNCTATAQATILDPPQLAINIQTTATCASFNQGTAIAVVSGGTAPYSYLWNTNPSQNTSNVSALPTGSYMVTVTDANGCSSTAMTTVDNHPAPLIDAGPDKDLCRGTGVQLTPTGGIGYVWTPATGLSCTTCSDPIASPLNDILYTVVGTDANNCKDTDEVHVTVVQPVPVEVGEAKEICKGESVFLHAGGGIAYLWSPGSSLDATDKPDPKATPTATTRYQVVITENKCFKDTLYQEVIVYPLPSIDLGPDQIGVPGITFPLEPNVNNAISIAWTPASGLSCYNCFKPVVTLDQTITYIATVTNEHGCTSQDDITITVECATSSFYMPNTFTPNGDGENDRFYPMGKGITRITRFAIFSRWGETVFEASWIPPNDPQYGWDGTFKNVLVKPDVFIYVAEAICESGQRVVVKGDIALIR